MNKVFLYLTLLMLLATAALAETFSLQADVPVSATAPFSVTATATSTAGAVTGVAVYLDGTSVYSNSQSNGNLSTTVSPSTGNHTVTVRFWDTTGAYVDAYRTVDVTSSSTPTPQPVGNSPTSSYTGGISGGVCWGAAGLWNKDIGRSPGPERADIRFYATVSGTAAALRYYASAGSHAIWTKCSNGSSCIAWSEALAQRYKPNGKYTTVIPNGWQPYADTCSTNYSGCYAAGTGGVMRAELQSDDGSSSHQPSGKVLAFITMTQPLTVMGYASTYPNLAFSNQVAITSGHYYHIVFTNTDANFAKNWYSIDNFTPLSQSASTMHQTGMTSPAVLVKDGSATSWTVNSNFYPIFNLAFTNGGRIGAGFCN